MNKGVGGAMGLWQQVEKWILSQSCGRVDRKENMVSIKVVTKVAESMKKDVI